MRARVCVWGIYHLLINIHNGQHITQFHLLMYMQEHPEHHSSFLRAQIQQSLTVGVSEAINAVPSWVRQPQI